MPSAMLSEQNDVTHAHSTPARHRLHEVSSSRQYCVAHAINSRPHSPPSKTIIGEIDLGLRDTQGRLFSASYLPQAKAGTSFMDDIGKAVRMTDDPAVEAGRSSTRTSQASATNSSYTGEAAFNNARDWVPTNPKTSSKLAAEVMPSSSKPNSTTTTKKLTKPSLSLVTRPTSGHEVSNSPQTPISPLGNGRDAYGNYIATNTNDYFLTQNLPSSLSIKNVHPETELGEQSQVPRLRGGGGFWNSLGLGLMTSRNSVKEGGRQTTRVQTIPSSRHSSNKQVDRKEGIGAYGPRQLILIPHGTMPLTQIDSSYGRTDLPVRERPRQHFSPISKNTESETGQNSPPARRVLKNFIKPERSSFLRAESTVSASGNHGRTDKRWANETVSGPPIKQNLPPPPLLPQQADRLARQLSFEPTIYLRGDQLVHIQAESQIQATTDHRDSPQSVSKLDSDFLSLQLGESVSMVGRELQEAYERERHSSQEPKSNARQPGSNPTSEEIEAWQERAQTEFRKRTQGIMARYNANKSSIERALHLDQITQDLHDNQAEFYNKSVQIELAEAAVDTGYAILDEPTAIAEAIKTHDGYAIYHDILEPTQPELWHQIEHHNLQQVFSAHQAAYRQHKSTWDQGVHVTGKIARFLLAAPSDPELKTASNRRPPPLSASSRSGTEVGDARGRKLVQDKGKGRAAEGVTSVQSFANSGPGIGSSGFAHLDVSIVPYPHIRPPAAQPIGRMASTDEPGKMGLFPPYRPAHHSCERNATTTVSAWPEGDSQGNWAVPRQPVMRGGGGKDKDLSGAGGKTTKKIRNFVVGKRPYVDYTAAMRMH